MIGRLQRRTIHLERISNKYWTVRRGIFICGSLLSLAACKYSGAPAGWVLTGVFVAVFCLVAIYHRRVRDSIVRNSLLLKIKLTQVARSQLNWDQMPLPDPSLSKATHPLETDLDITGERSLHRLIDCAITKEGSHRLKSWLLNNTPEPLIITKRQSQVRELKQLSVFRDKLQLLSAIAGNDAKHASGQWEANILVDWVQKSVPKKSLVPTLKLLSILAGLNITLIILAGLNLTPHVWPIAFIIYAGVMISRQSQISSAWGELQELEKALRRFRLVFAYLESRSYENQPGVAEICAPFVDEHNRPSAELKRLERLASALGLRTNALLWLAVHALVPWDFYCTYHLELLKQEIVHFLPDWLDAWHELEALNSLANFAYLNPHYVFPVLSSELTVFAGRSLGHPLLKREFKVRNDFELDETTRIVILTGSNMAGKSTFLRTIGVNLCLSYAGAPVDADSLRVSLFRIFSCIKVSDSVQDGFSYFYAEVRRLKALLEAIKLDENRAVLFLIDEIFRGTNSRERLIGSRAYIRALAQGRTLGIVATHDLELVNLALERPGIANFHFRDDVHEGKMVFDYLLRPGPCPTTNALQIMKMEGLPVES